jgi:hypothetical protein
LSQEAFLFAKTNINNLFALSNNPALPKVSRLNIGTYLHGLPGYTHTSAMERKIDIKASDQHDAVVQVVFDALRGVPKPE